MRRRSAAQARGPASSSVHLLHRQTGSPLVEGRTGRGTTFIRDRIGRLSSALSGGPVELACNLRPVAPQRAFSLWRVSLLRPVESYSSRSTPSHKFSTRLTALRTVVGADERRPTGRGRA